MLRVEQNKYISKMENFVFIKTFKMIFYSKEVYNFASFRIQILKQLNFQDLGSVMHNLTKLSVLLRDFTEMLKSRSFIDLKYSQELALT